MILDFMVTDIKCSRKYEGVLKYFTYLSLLFLSSKVFVSKILLQKRQKGTIP